MQCTHRDLIASARESRGSSPLVGCRVDDPAQVEGKTPPSKVMSRHLILGYYLPKNR